MTQGWDAGLWGMFWGGRKTTTRIAAIPRKASSSRSLPGRSGDRSWPAIGVRPGRSGHAMNAVLGSPSQTPYFGRMA
ncbi:hypothetical protein ASF34_12955 [Methylobacterium sp. Leaf106]|nr:hypothetical protein ASF34_12955 [Methylobacterium sp. Leaf106]